MRQISQSTSSVMEHLAIGFSSPWLRTPAAGISGVSNFLNIGVQFRVNYVRASAQGRAVNAGTCTIRADKRGVERKANWKMVEERVRLFLWESTSADAVIHCDPVEGPEAPLSFLRFSPTRRSV